MKPCAIVVCLALALSAAAGAQEGWVAAEGSAEGTGEAALEVARQRALEALVLLAGGDWIESRSEARHHRLLREMLLADAARLVGPVVVERTLREEGRTRLALRCRLAPEQVARAWEALAARLSGLRRPRIALALFAGRHEGATALRTPAARALKGALEAQLRAKGFPLVERAPRPPEGEEEPTTGQWAAAARAAGAEAVVVGHFRLAGGRSVWFPDVEYSVATAQAELAASLVRADTAERIASWSRAVHSPGFDREHAASQAVQQGAAALARWIEHELLKSQLVGPRRLRAVEVEVAGVSFAEAQALEAELARAPGVASVEARRLAGGVQHWTVQCTLPARDLALILARQTAVALVVTGYDEGKVIARRR